MAMITVTHLCGDRFRAETRGHALLLDQPRRDGAEVGPTSLELTAMALAGCAAQCAVEYLRERGLPSVGLEVDCHWWLSTEPARIHRVELCVVPPEPLRPEHQAGLLAAVDRCTVRNTLRRPPQVDTVVGGRTPTRSGGRVGA
jgi:putative redox protein